jgi:hypothetical protein
MGDNSCFKCKYCQQNDFISLKGLHSHQNNYAPCQQKRFENNNGDEGYFTAQESLPFAQNMHKMAYRSKLELAKVKVLEGALYKAKLMAELENLNNKLGTHKENYDTAVEYSSKDDNAMDISHGSSSNDESVQGQFNNEDNSKCSENCPQPNNSIWSNFLLYLAQAHHFLPLKEEERAAICLLCHLHKTKASLNTFESVFAWHLKEIGVLGEHEPLSKSATYVSQNSLFKFLWKRYNMMEGWGKVTEITLSSSKSWVKVISNDFACVAQHLLTDPQIKWDDYLWFDNDPLAPPPDNLDRRRPSW